MNSTSPAVASAAGIYKSSCGTFRVAALLVGLFAYDGKLIDHGHIVKGSPEVHVSALAANVIRPLEADVFIATNAPPQINNKVCKFPSFATILGNDLKTVAFDEGIGTSSCVTYLNLNKDSRSKSIVFRVIPPAKGHHISASTAKDSETNNEVNAPFVQWYRLRECWKLMESHESATLKSHYDVVIKLRFDWYILFFSFVSNQTSLPPYSCFTVRQCAYARLESLPSCR